MAVNTGARSLEIQPVKPVDNKRKGKCPCNAFLRCCSRRPYGNDVWGDKDKRAKAMGEIAYGGGGTMEKKDELVQTFKKIVSDYKEKAAGGKTPKWKQNEFFMSLKTLKEDRDKGPRALVMPEITEAEMDMHMGALEVGNLARFTDFQRSLVARANLVRNGMVMISDRYLDKHGREVYSPGRLLPYSGGYTPGQWSVDHIQVRSKGGCNRFCNAGVLSVYNNCTNRKDDGPGCPCAQVYEKGQSPIEGQNLFDKGAGGAKYKLYECSSLCMNKKNAENKLPDNPPGKISEYPRICDVDDPRKWSMKKSKESVAALWV